MSYFEIIKNIDYIESVRVKGNSVIINKDRVFEYKYPAVAKAVARKVSFFIGVK